MAWVTIADVSEDCPQTLLEIQQGIAMNSHSEVAMSPRAQKHGFNKAGVLFESNPC